MGGKGQQIKQQAEITAIYNLREIEQEQPRGMDLPNCNKPILAMHKVHHNSTNSNTFFLTTIDGYIYQITQATTYQKLVHKFQLAAPCTSVFYHTPANQQLILGCSNGSVYLYDLDLKQFHQSNYTDPAFPEDIICVYVRTATIYAWNINSEIVLLNRETMLPKSKLSLQLDICSIISVGGDGMSNHSACVAFSGFSNPFIFDCDTGVSLRDTYMSIKNIQEQGSYQIKGEDQSGSKTEEKTKAKVSAREEVELMTANKQGTIVAAHRCYRNEKKYYLITVYKIEREGKVKICEPQQKIILKNQPIFMDIYRGYVLVGEEEKIRLFDLALRKVCFSMSVRRAWGFIIFADQLNRVFSFGIAIAKGFNIWSEQGWMGKSIIQFKYDKHQTALCQL